MRFRPRYRGGIKLVQALSMIETNYRLKVAGMYCGNVLPVVGEFLVWIRPIPNTPKRKSRLNDMLNAQLQQHGM